MTQDRKAVKRKGPQFLPGNDSELADLILASDGAGLAYVSDLRKWRAWDGHTWQDCPDGGWVRTAVIERFVKELRIDRENKEQLNTRAKYLSATKITHVEQRLRDKLGCYSHEFDSNPALVTTNTGTLNVRTLEENDCEYADMITKHIPTDYVPDVPPGQWARWLEIMLPDHRVRRALQTIMGYGAFTDGNPERIMVWLQGQSSTGKSTFVEAVGAVLGPLACTYSPSIFQGTKGESARPDIRAVLKRRLIYTSETAETVILHADMIKRLVGNDKISSRQMYQAETSDMPSFMPIMVTNEIPNIKGADAALLRRWVGIKFEHTIPKERERGNVAQRLAARCGPEIFKWLLDGYQRYLVKGAYGAVRQLSGVSAAMFAESSAFANYLYTHTAEVADHKVTNDEAYHHFLAHTEDAVGKTEFGRRMSALGWNTWRTARTKGRIGRKLI